MKKIISWVLCILMLLPLAISCSKRGGSDEKDTTVVTTEGDPALVADVPDVDMGEKTFTIVTDNWWGNILCINDDFSAEMITGDLVQDEQFKSLQVVKERFNCFLNEANFSGPSESVTKIRADYQAGDKAYDIYLTRGMYWQALTQEGLLHNLRSDSIEYLDFDKPWWDSKSAKEMSVLGKLYCVAGDVSLQDEYSTSCMVFNKKLFEDYKLDDPYQMVKDNNWTFETFHGLAKQLSEDVDNNGAWDENDKYGLLYQRDMLNAMVMASGITYVQKDREDKLTLSINSKQSVDVIGAAMDVLYDNCSLQVMNLPNYVVLRDKMFQNNQALFSFFYMKSLESLRKMETDFGILPVPKYSADQTEWYSEVSAWSCGYIALPMQNQGENLTWTCIFLEALGCERHKMVLPTYYDKLLTGIVARDGESYAMLEIIFNNRRYDLGASCNFGSLTELIYLTMTNSREISSYLGGRSILAKREINEFMEKIAKVE